LCIKVILNYIHGFCIYFGYRFLYVYRICHRYILENIFCFSISIFYIFLQSLYLFLSYIPNTFNIFEISISMLFNIITKHLIWHMYVVVWIIIKFIFSILYQLYSIIIFIEGNKCYYFHNDRFIDNV